MIWALILWNVIVFCVYGFDKLRAIKDGYRISERALINMAFLMGGIGAYLGMQIFRHKTRKMKFNILVPVAIVVNCVAVTLIIKIQGL